AEIHADASGQLFGVAVGSTSSRVADRDAGALPPQPDGSPPPQLYSFGTIWSPVPFAPPTLPQPGDPYRTDLVATSFDDTGRGWVAGDPEGWRPILGGANAPQNGRVVPTAPEPAPLLPITLLGTSDPDCAGPPDDQFEHVRDAGGPDD